MALKQAAGGDGVELAELEAALRRLFGIAGGNNDNNEDGPT
ncbi:MAG: hypothetical protein VW338_12520 [Rhodospirillaceae bacterium]